MSEFKPIRTRRGKRIHATDVEDYRRALCGVSVDGGRLEADSVPDCRSCLRLLVEMQTN